MLDLTGAEVLSSGAYRTCFVHPDDASLCVKVIHERGHARLTRDKRPWRHAPLDPNRRELLGYARIAELGEAARRWFVPVHGMIDTSRGPGLVVERLGVDVTQLSMKEWLAEPAAYPEVDRDEVLARLDDYAAVCLAAGLHGSALGRENIALIPHGEGGLRLIAFDVKVTESKTLLPFIGDLPAARRRRIRRRAETLRRLVTGISPHSGPSNE